ncbi:MAG: hypothetical protein MH472_14565 [Bacteroidia bacterium]|nr:hypothetical protein [Bacteroidia bacterium]
MAKKYNFVPQIKNMKQIIEKIKAELGQDGFDTAKVISLLKELREYFKQNLKEPGYVRMIRLAYENLEENDDYTFLYLEDADGKENLSYLVDLLADHGNKYNREELQDIRNLMEGIEPEPEDEEIED